MFIQDEHMLVVQSELRSPPIGTLKLKVNSFAFGNPGRLGIGVMIGEHDGSVLYKRHL